MLPLSFHKTFQFLLIFYFCLSMALLAWGQSKNKITFYKDNLCLENCSNNKKTTYHISKQVAKLIYERNVHRNFLSKLGIEKIVFLYFYISAFCCLADRPTDKIFIE